MIGGQADATVVAVALAAVWIVIATALSIAAARRLRRAGAVLQSAQAMSKLLEVAPARPLVVHADGRLEADPRLLRELGISGSPASLAELAGDECGFDEEDLDGLIAAVEAAAESCEPFDRKVRVAGSRRVFEVRGGQAPAPEPPGTVLLWLFDTSATEEERARLSLRLSQTSG